MRSGLLALLIAATSLAGCGGDGIAPPESGRVFGEMTGDFSGSLSGNALASIAPGWPSSSFVVHLTSDDEATTRVEISLGKVGARPGVGSYPVSLDGPFVGYAIVSRADGTGPFLFGIVSGTLTVRHSSSTAFSGTFTDLVAEESHEPEPRVISLRGSFNATCNSC